jgi:hypothetical protein
MLPVTVFIIGLWESDSPCLWDYGFSTSNQNLVSSYFHTSSLSEFYANYGMVDPSLGTLVDGIFTIKTQEVFKLREKYLKNSVLYNKYICICISW